MNNRDNPLVNSIIEQNNTSLNNIESNVKEIKQTIPIKEKSVKVVKFDEKISIYKKENTSEPNSVIEKKYWYNDLHILSIILIIIILIIIITLLFWFFWKDKPTAENLSTKGDIKLHKTSSDSIFLYTNLKFPEELKIYKPKPINIKDRELPNIADYLRIITITEKCKYALERYNEIEEGYIAEFIVYKYPTNEIVFSSTKKYSQVELEPGEYNILLVTLYNEDLVCSYRKITDEPLREEIEQNREEIQCGIDSVKSKLYENGYELVNEITIENKIYEFVPNFIKHEIKNLEVLKDQIIVVLLNNNSTKNYISIVKDKEEINCQAYNYINSLEVIDDGLIDISTYTLLTDLPKKLTVLIFQ